MKQSIKQDTSLKNYKFQTDHKKYNVSWKVKILGSKCNFCHVVSGLNLLICTYFTASEPNERRLHIYRVRKGLTSAT